ncbi:MAG TPA: hypothetical protein V6C81_15290 [Planktothrix sp.]|jgi:hypothetical protein
MSIESADMPVVVDNSHGAAAAQAQGAYEKMFAQAHGDGSGNSSVNDLVYRTTQGDQNMIKRYINGDDGDSPTVVDGGHFHFPDISKLFGNSNDVPDAEKKFDKEISGLSSDADQDLIKRIGHAVLEGKPEDLAAALKGIHDPAKLAKVVKEMNRIFRDLGTDTQLAIGPNGHVLEYSKSGNVAIEMDPASGTVVGERPIEVNGSTVTLKDGTILNGDVDGDAKSIATGTVSSIENPLGWRDDPMKPVPYHPDRPWAGTRPYDPFPSDKPWFMDMQQKPSDITLLST